MTTQNPVVAVVGPTGSGKSAFATELASRLGGEIICMDSTTVYRGFTIGSAKPLPEDRARVPHHLVDILDPDAPFSAYLFVEWASRALSDVHSRGKIPILVGGTYFYLRALQNGMAKEGWIPTETLETLELEFSEDDEIHTGRMHDELSKRDPAAAAKIHKNDKYRLLRALAIARTGVLKPSQLVVTTPLESQSRLWIKYSMLVSRHHLTQVITRRTETMLAAGLVQETKNLLEKWPTAKALASIGYQECCRHLRREITEKQLRNEIIEKTRQLAKRQVTWIRSDPEIRFVDSRDIERAQAEIGNLLTALASGKDVKGPVLTVPNPFNQKTHDSEAAACAP